MQKLKAFFDTMTGLHKFSGTLLRLTNLFLLLAIVGAQSGAFAGTIDMDSLKARLSQVPPDTNKVWLLRDIAYYYQSVDLDSAIHYSDMANQLAGVLDFPNGRIWSLYQKALAIEMKHGLDSAFPIYTTTLQIAGDQHDHLSLAKLLNAVGVAHYFAGSFHHAVAYYQRAFELADSLSYMQGVNHALNNMGVIYRLQRRYEQALEMYEKSLDMKRVEQDSIGMVNTLYNIGLAHSYLGNYEKSLATLREAEHLSQQLVGADLTTMANIQVGLGVALYNMDDLEGAEKHIRKGLEHAISQGSHEWIAAMNYLGALDVKNDKPAEGLEKIKQAHAAALASGRLELLRQTLREKAIAASLAGDHALAHQSWLHHSVLVDSLNKENKLWAQQEMQARFELFEKTNTILTQQQMLLRENRKARLLIRLGVVLTLLLMTGVLVLRMIIKQRKDLMKTVASNEISLTRDRQLKLQRFSQLLPEPLSKREKDVLQALDQGLTNRQIAEKLFLSEHTIKSHLKNIFIKTGVKNRTELLSKLN